MKSKKSNRSSTAKIASTLEVNPLRIPIKKTLNRAEIELVPINRICFRGDSRAPDDIFSNGFQKREVISKALYNKIEEMVNTHLKDDDNNNFNPDAFKADFNKLKDQISTEASDKLAQECEALGPLHYEDWLLKIIRMAKKNALIVEEDAKAFKKTKPGIKTIRNPFHSQHLVASSKRFKSAIPFPVNPSKKQSYVYVVYVEKGFDVHMHGVVSSMLHSDKSKPPDLKAALQQANPDMDEAAINKHLKSILVIQQVMNIPLKQVMFAYVEEIVTESIDTEHVVLSVKVERQLEFKDRFSRGSYKLGEIEINENCSLPKKIIDQVASFMREEKRLNHAAYTDKGNPKDAKIIEPEDGFNKGFSSS